MGKTWTRRKQRYKAPERDTPKSRRDRGLRNRRHVERAEAGGCGKRMWRTIEQAEIHVRGALTNPLNQIAVVGIYFCPRCEHFHQTRRVDGPDIVRIISRS
jgi:hypothetical protein